MISPRFISFTQFIHSLTVDFPSAIIPVVINEDEWKFYGNVVANSVTFARAGMPNTDDFKEWLPWAERVYGILG